MSGHVSADTVLKVTVFSDYICPFCYIGDARLDKLKDRYEVAVEWCFFEIHPQNPPQGKPVSELGYSPQQWARMMANFKDMARDEGLPVAERSFTTNSHRAMLLAEAAKDLGQAVFELLHKRLFTAYFNESRNIGDPEVLQDLARECGITPDAVQRAWSDPELEQRLASQARRGAALGITGVPACLIGRYLVPGAVPVQTLLQVAGDALQEQSAGGER